ncbi:Hypothetical protein SMAX5B_019086 [Scophthalmus maximus]|uniref:Uncharacterized protein n=1 Tax=Scophthalmus maximus TaxID=52904 RepID=A0A2U9C9R4_SCOMX|nr:Hypothetical protein SMAX5B_019086 [Scophthalmus maximus]
MQASDTSALAPLSGPSDYTIKKAPERVRGARKPLMDISLGEAEAATLDVRQSSERVYRVVNEKQGRRKKHRRQLTGSRSSSDSAGDRQQHRLGLPGILDDQAEEDESFLSRITSAQDRSTSASGINAGFVFERGRLVLANESQTLRHSQWINLTIILFGDRSGRISWTHVVLALKLPTRNRG